MTLLQKTLVFGVIALFVSMMVLPATGQAVVRLQGQVLGASISCPTTMDINGDGIVNSLDLAMVISHEGKNFPAADLNKDGAVNAADVSLLMNCWFAVR